MLKEIKSCLICGSELNEVLNLGEQYVVDFVKEKDESLLKAPLILMCCSKCSLIQLKHRVNPDRLYKKFWYRSGINEQMKNELLSIVKKAQETVDMKAGDRVLDIGCNDGTLLGWYDKQTFTVGIDPCKNLVDEGVKAGKIDIGIPDYFSKENVYRMFTTVGVKPLKFKIITAIAMFYDTEDPVGFLKDCKDLLDDEGVLVIQMNYLVSMLLGSAFDNVSHEHLTYFSLSTLKKAVLRAGLDIQGIELSDCNGGSIRAYITHPEFNNFSLKHHQNKLWLYQNSQLKEIAEDKMHLSSVDTYKNFAKNVDLKMGKVREYIDAEKGKVYAYGASTRGTVTTQYLFKDGGADKVVAVAERDSNKLGLKMVGTWWPIISEDEFRQNANLGVVLPWHFRESITRREIDWINGGGQFLFPLPDPMLVTSTKKQDDFALGKKL